MAGTSYTRQSTLTDGDTITASLFNAEYNQLVSAFSYAASGTTGHQHDGSAGEGGNIHTIGDQDFKNKIVVDSTNNRWSVYVEVGGTAVEQVRIEDGVVYPVTDSDVDLGTNALRFKDAYIDSLTATGNLTIGGNITVTGNVDVDGIVEFDGLSGTGAVTVTDILDQDDMSSDSATALATQQSIKAYVDSQVTAQDLDLTDGTTSISIDLDSEALSVLGGTGVTSTASGNGVTLAIDSTVATLTGSQTFTNKILTSPDVNTPDIDGGTIDGTIIGGTTAAAGSFTTVDATGNITVAGTVDGRDVAADGTKLDGVETAATADQTDAEIRAAVEAATDSNVFTDADHSKLNAIEASADVTDTTNVTAAGALMDSELTSIASVKALDQGVATTDSPTFAAATVTGEITANGGIALGDNDKATFGASDDLQIYSDGTDGYIDNVTGDFYIRDTTGGTLHLQAKTGEEGIVIHDDGGVDLYRNNALKMSTTSTGIDVTGTATMDGLTVDGGAFDLRLDSTEVYSSTAQNISQLTVKNWDTTTANTPAVLSLQARGSTTTTSNWQLGNAGLNTTYSESDFFIKNRISGSGYRQRLLIAGNGDISFYEDTGTTPKLFWDASAESLGIGTSSPSAKLHLKDDFSSGVAVVYDRTENALVSNLFYTGVSSTFNSSFMWMGTSATSFVINNSGNVGIGTSAPACHLDVKGSGNGSVSDHLRITSTDTDSKLAFVNTTGNGAIVQSGHNMRFMTNTANTERMRIDASGNVGIGTSSPSSALDLGSGDLRFTGGAGQDIAWGSASVDYAAIRRIDPASQDVGLSFHTTTNAGVDGAPERLRIDSSGLVSIKNTTAPTLRIENTDTGLSANETIGDIDFYQNDPSGDGVGVVGKIRSINSSGFQGEAGLAFHTGTASGLTERMRIDSSGNLLVGKTTASYNASGRSNVEISGASSALLSLSSGSNDSYFYQSGTGLNIFNTANGYLRFATNDTERMRIDSGGSLLIGQTVGAVYNQTSVTGLKLDGPNGNLQIARANNPTLLLNRYGNDGDLALFFKDGTGVGSIGTSGTHTYFVGNNGSNGCGLLFGVNVATPVNRLGTAYDGFLNLGTSSNRFKDLHLSGGLRGDTTFKNNAGTTEYARFDSLGNLLVGTTSWTTGGGGLRVTSSGRSDLSRNTTSSTQAMNFANPNGFVGNITLAGSTTTYNTSSDQRLKENIADADDAGSKIDAIQVRKYDWKVDGSHQDYGMIAQELLEVAPEAVSVPEDSEEMMGVDYSKLVPMLIKEIQSLRNRVAQLEE